MLDNGAAQNQNAFPQQIALGDPVPWFSAATITGGSFHLQVAAGRWIVLCFLGAGATAAQQKLTALFRDTDLFDEDRLVGHVVLTAPPEAPDALAATGNAAVSFLADYDRTLRYLSICAIGASAAAEGMYRNIKRPDQA